MLELRGIHKSFGPVHVLRDVSLTLRPGEIHAICGENGAGKSTTMKIVTGIYQPDAGEVLFEGRPLRSKSYRESLRRGIDIIHQEIQVIPTATVAENVMLDKLPTRRGVVDWREVDRVAQRYMDLVRLDLPAATPMRRLSAAQKQLAQIAKALSADAKVLLLDEPTSSLTGHEADNLFGLLRRLRDDGRTLVFVSHKLDEVFALCDRVSVLRDGQCVASRAASELTKDELVRLMIGRDSPNERPGPPIDVGRGEALRAVGLTRAGRANDINFGLNTGEILGFYGLVGSGRTEVARLLIGDDRPDAGEIRLRGKAVRLKSVGDTLRTHRVGYVTENRKEEGLFLHWPIVGNITITVWDRFRNRFTRRIDPVAERDTARRLSGELGVRASGIDQPVGQLSGGNQQKVSIAKWLAADCDVLIIDEPTVGVDVGAKDQIHKLIYDLAARHGKSIILISSDMPEIIRLAGRILVFKDRRIVGEVTGVDRPGSTYEKTSEAIGRLLV